MARKLIVEIVGDSSNVERAFKRTSHSANLFERDIGKASRGALAGSGIFRGLGRSLAFASGGFLAFASVSELLRKSVDAATDAAATQRQLGAQFKANGQSLAQYQARIDAATLATSRLSGFTADELTQAFTTAFRGSQKVGVGLRIQAIAADVARGRHIDLAKSAIALTKAYGGQTTALRRLGIQVPTTLSGMKALEFVAGRFAGQAAAGTTAQERFAAALHNTEVSIGSAILPSLTKYLNKATIWLDNSEHQAEIQRKMAHVMRTTGKVLNVTGEAFGIAAKAAHPMLTVMENMVSVGKRLNDVFKKSRWFVAPEAMLALKAAGFLKGILPGGGGKLGPGTSPIGENALGGGENLAGTATAGAAARQRTGLAAQFRRTQLALAQAQVTAGTVDDRRVLAEQAKIIRAALSQTTNLKKRKDLYEKLASVENQIRTIDEHARQTREDAQQKELAAAKAHQQKMRELLRQQRAKVAQVRDDFRAAMDSVRSQIGELFGGPVLNPTDDARRRTLGLGRPMSQDPRKLTADVRAQTAAWVAFQRDLARLQKRGASGALLGQLRQQGLSAAAQVHALAGAPKGVLTGFFKAFGARERTVIRAARLEVHTPNVRIVTDGKPIIVPITVTLDGKVVADTTHRHQTRKSRNHAAQTRGPHAGTKP